MYIKRRADDVVACTHKNAHAYLYNNINAHTVTLRFAGEKLITSPLYPAAAVSFAEQTILSRLGTSTYILFYYRYICIGTDRNCLFAEFVARLVQQHTHSMYTHLMLYIYIVGRIVRERGRL